MSADAWQVCPQCSNGLHKEIEDVRTDMTESYGKVTADEFLYLIEKLAKLERDAEKAGDDFRQHTFREDYEIYGAETGTLTVSYHGQCTECGLKLSVKETYPFYPAPNNN